MQYNFGLGKRTPYRSDMAEIIEIVPSSSLNFFENPTSSSNIQDLQSYYYPNMANIANDVESSSSTLSSATNQDGNDFEFRVIPAFAPALQKPFIPMSVSFIDSTKRSRPQRFSFGLGKRSKEQVMFNDIIDDDNNDQTIDNGDDVLMNVAEKRKIQPYGFGLGKRMITNYNENYNNKQKINGKKIKKLTNFEDFIKRRYSFGLGKRSVWNGYPVLNKTTQIIIENNDQSIDTIIK